VVGAILGFFVLSPLCWLALWDVLWSTRLRHVLKTSGGGCLNGPEYTCDVVVFGDYMWVVAFV
jgi:hypothetical protein